MHWIRRAVGVQIGDRKRSCLTYHLSFGCRAGKRTVYIGLATGVDLSLRMLNSIGGQGHSQTGRDTRLRPFLKPQ